jgi:hypothetical protein
MPSARQRRHSKPALALSPSGKAPNRIATLVPQDRLLVGKEPGQILLGHLYRLTGAISLNSTLCNFESTWLGGGIKGEDIDGHAKA